MVYLRPGFPANFKSLPPERQEAIKRSVITSRKLLDLRSQDVEFINIDSIPLDKRPDWLKGVPTMVDTRSDIMQVSYGQAVLDTLNQLKKSESSFQSLFNEGHTKDEVLRQPTEEDMRGVREEIVPQRQKRTNLDVSHGMPLDDQSMEIMNRVIDSDTSLQPYQPRKKFGANVTLQK